MSTAPASVPLLSRPSDRASITPRDDAAIDTVHFLGCTISTRTAWLAVIVGCTALWLAMRVVFFLGLEGSDDLFHVRYAALLNHAPINHWEARLIANGLIAAAIRLFGQTEWAAVLPCMLAPLVVQFTVYYACWRYATVRHAAWAGLIAAVAPVNVNLATVVSAYPIMAALMMVGTFALGEAPTSRRARWVAACALATGCIVHLYGVYYLALLSLAAMVVNRRRFFQPLMGVCLACIVAFACDMMAFYVLTGNPLGRVHILAGTHLGSDDACGYPAFDLVFVLQPLAEFLFNRSFGLAAVVAAVYGIMRYRRLDASMRLLLVSSALFWLFLYYGSQVPWQYRPIWRYPRYHHPETLTVAVFCAAALVEWRPRLGRLAPLLVPASCVLILTCAGDWGQSTRISRDLLAYVQQHPQSRFVTDFHTANEMYILAGLRTPANIVTTGTCRKSYLLDRDLPRMAARDLQPTDRILVNPLNARAERAADFAAWLAALPPAWQSVHESPPAYRDICTLLPPLKALPWAVRRPASKVLAFNVDSASAMSGPGR